MMLTSDNKIYTCGDNVSGTDSGNNYAENYYPTEDKVIYSGSNNIIDI